MVVETAYVPTCPGNTPEDGSGLCGAATTTCPRPGDTRVWVYTRQVSRSTGQQLAPWRLRTPNGITCVGPDVPGIDPLVAVVATVRREFQRFPLERAVVQTRPSGTTLVNATTIVTTTADGRDEVRKTILGLPVVVSAVAVSYTWHFGDGSAVTAGGGRAPSVIEHVYRGASTQQLSLDITYGGTFTVGDSPVVYDVQGTAEIPGATTALQVAEARTQLEDGARR